MCHIRIQFKFVCNVLMRKKHGNHHGKVLIIWPILFVAMIFFSTRSTDTHTWNTHCSIQRSSSNYCKIGNVLRDYRTLIVIFTKFAVLLQNYYISVIASILIRISILLSKTFGPTINSVYTNYTSSGSRQSKSWNKLINLHTYTQKHHISTVLS